MRLPTGIFILILAISGSIGGGHHGPSKNLYNFLTLLSGYFANYDQVNTDQHGDGLDYHENTTVFWRPVFIKKLHGRITFYVEVTINEEVTQRAIWVISEDRQGVIHVQSSNVLGRESHKPCSLEDVHRQDYRDLEYEPLPDTPECEALFYSVDVDVFVGTIPICVGIKDGKPARISVTLTCHSVSLNFDGIESKLPYIEFKDDSYTLPKYITRGVHYDSPCHYG
ncbi:hypothetical protein Btru_032270 [Bulinus truncatus]|nr:hypothetical protein Btru_032270 [Bulinus truncatus]